MSSGPINYAMALYIMTMNDNEFIQKHNKHKILYISYPGSYFSAHGYLGLIVISVMFSIY